MDRAGSWQRVAGGLGDGEQHLRGQMACLELARLQEEHLVLVGPTSGTSYNSALKLQKATQQLGDIPFRQIGEKKPPKTQTYGNLPARVRTVLLAEAQQSQRCFSKRRCGVARLLLSWVELGSKQPQKKALPAHLWCCFQIHFVYKKTEVPCSFLPTIQCSPTARGPPVSAQHLLQPISKQSLEILYQFKEADL